MNDLKKKELKTYLERKFSSAREIKGVKNNTGPITERINGENEMSEELAEYTAEVATEVKLREVTRSEPVAEPMRQNQFGAHTFGQWCDHEVKRINKGRNPLFGIAKRVDFDNDGIPSCRIDVVYPINDGADDE